MELSKIKESIKNWNEIAKDKVALKSLLSNQSHFEFNASPSIFPEVIGQTIHAYPGVYENDLVYFLISSVYDNETFFGSNDMEDFIVPCNMVSPIVKEQKSGVEISNQDAIDRIENWKNYSDQWIDKIVLTEDGIYRAFCIPNVDLNAGTDYKYKPFLALEGNIGSFTADLIIENIKPIDTFDQYTDTVYPVPPFGGGGSANSFYLLDISII